MVKERELLPALCYMMESGASHCHAEHLVIKYSECFLNASPGTMLEMLVDDWVSRK